MAACDAGIELECREPEAEQEGTLSDETVFLAFQSQHRFSSNSLAQQATTEQATAISSSESGYVCGKLVGDEGDALGGAIHTKSRRHCEEQCQETSGCHSFAWIGSRCHLKNRRIKGEWGSKPHGSVGFVYIYIPPSWGTGQYNSDWQTCYKVRNRCDPCFTCKAGTESLADVSIVTYVGYSGTRRWGKMCKHFCSVDGYCNGAWSSYLAQDCTQCSEYLQEKSYTQRNALDSRDSM
jgi:hypothetical protein